jgi:hypothetical protein
MVYRTVAAARSDGELNATLDEIRDRYGAPPDSVLNLAEYGRIRIMADRLGVESIDREGRLVVLKFRPLARVDPIRLVTVVHEWPGATLVPPVSLKLDLDAPLDHAAAKAGAPRSGDLKASGSQGRTPPGGSAHTRPVAGSRRPSGLRSPTGRQEASWWTARATAGAVTAGFTKEEILRRPDTDPRAEGGMFSRLERLLEALG